MSAGQIFAAYFGYPTGAVWSNLIASAICSLMVWWRLRARQIRQHAEQKAVAAEQHRERMAQAQAHYEALTALAEKHHQEELDRADVHAEAVKASVAAVKPEAGAK